MADDATETTQPGSGAAAAAARPLPEAARRALAEAAERTRQHAAAPRPAEIHGRNGPEPTRYGDWERNGILSDF